MAYIGRDTDKISNIEKLDTITFDGSSSYTLQKNSVNFTPNSANSLQVSIDGVVQAGNFTVSGSTIDFGVAIPATSTNDFIFHYGTGLITTPADGTVTEAKIGSGAVTTAKIADANVTSAKMFSGFANGITMADQWRLTADFTGNATPISSNLEQVDTSGQGTLGSSMTESSGVFTFPETGIYLVSFICAHDTTGNNDGEIHFDISLTTNNSTYSLIAKAYGAVREGESNTSTASSLIDVTDIANVKVRFIVSEQGQNNTIKGDTSQNETHFTFIRLGDT